MNDYIIKVKNVSKVIGNKKILDNINFNIKRGSVVGLVGPNGAGKSTLLKIMTGLYTLDVGDVYYNNISLKNNYESAIKIVGSVIETPDLYKNLSGMDNLKMFMPFYSIDKDKIDEILSIVNMKESINKKVKTYSLGMKEKLSIVSALLGSPKILILDEPTNGLDPLGIKRLRNLISSLEDTTVIISSHYLSEINNICNEIIFLNKGKIIERKIINKDDNKYIKFEVDDYERAKEIVGKYCVNEDICIYGNDEDASIINRALVDSGIKVYSINNNSVLEKEFFDMVGESDD